MKLDLILQEALPSDLKLQGPPCPKEKFAPAKLSVLVVPQEAAFLASRAFFSFSPKPDSLAIFLRLAW